MSITNIITNYNFKINHQDKHILKRYAKYLFKIYNDINITANEVKLYHNERLTRLVAILFFIKNDANILNNLLIINNPEILTIYYLENNDINNAIKYYSNVNNNNIIYFYRGNTLMLATIYDKLKNNYLVAIELYKKNKSNITVNIYFKIGLCYYNLEIYDKAINYFLLSYQNDNELLYYISKYYYDIKKNYSLAKKYLLLSAKYGNIDALNRLGLYYETIIGDNNTALRYYKASSDSNNPDSQLNLGNYYYSKYNYDEALKYFYLVINNNKSNDKLISIAYYNIAKHYNTILIDTNKAIKYFKLSFDKGFLEAGILLLNYDEKYISILEKYNNNNNILIGLAKYYEKKNINKTIDYYNKAFENDKYDLRVLKYLYNYYFCSYDNKYKIYLDIIINKYENECSHLLGNYYELMQDNINCIKYYLIGINKNCVLSMNDLGIHYLINRNYKQAYKYLKMACNKGYTLSIYNLAFYYELVDDIPNAIKYYKECIEKTDMFNKAIISLENIFINNPQYLINELTHYNLSYVYYYKHPKLIYIKNNFIINKFDCDICYGQYDKYVLSKCNHKYCISCFLKIDNCAFCRKDF
jgi:TPR repeat protein